MKTQVLKNLETSALREEMVAQLHLVCRALQEEQEELDSVVVEYEVVVPRVRLPLP